MSRCPFCGRSLPRDSADERAGRCRDVEKCCARTGSVQRTSCTRESYCVLQVGHEGPCSPSFRRAQP